MYVLVKILLWIYLQIYSHSLWRLIPDDDIICFIDGSIRSVMWHQASCLQIYTLTL